MSDSTLKIIEVTDMKNIKNSNVYEIIVYILENIFYGVLIALIYKNTIFIPIQHFTYENSIHVLYVMMLIGVITGTLLTYNKHRNSINLFASVVIPIEIYSLIVYSKYFSVFYTIVIIIAVVLCIAITAFIFIQKIKSRIHKLKVMLKRLCHSFFCNRCLSSVVLTLVFIPIVYSVYINGSLIKPSIEALDINTRGDYTIANNISTVSNLSEDKWCLLTMQEKIDTLQTIANIEANYLGLENELNVTVELLDEHTLGCYRNELHMITLNEYYFSTWTAHQALETLCHECRHSYQHSLAEVYDKLEAKDKELLIFWNAKKYKENIVHGQSSDFLEYYFSPMEIDARSYSKKCVTEYYDRIASASELN